MPRYFLALSYKGTAYRGFQVQENAHTVQAEVEKALGILLPGVMELTGSSRTDAGVHARQNYFHFDIPEQVETYRGINTAAQFVYKVNAILPPDIAVLSLQLVKEDAHCRFDAIQRDYRYYIYTKKDPFHRDRAYYFPFRLQEELLQEAAGIIREYHDFTSFSKRNTQVKTFICSIVKSQWIREGDLLVYEVGGNRFLRGMVRALTATMLRVGRGLISLEEFREIIESRDCTRASFAVPPNGLFLEAVRYPQNYFD
ncbi:MAG: tRNA pseudouridine(38-40) synthase TruA [Chitinophagaceae bacterium]|nr:tRNA pseudouridine(38-40) synthase TruA [Chitinophagaceae bacterium]